MLAQLSLQKKLLLLCSGISAIAIIGGVVSYINLHNVDRSYNHVANVNLPKTVTLSNLRVEYRNVRIYLRTLGLPGIAAEDANRAVAEVKKAIENYEKEELAYKKNPFVPGEEALFAKVNEEWQKFKEVGGQVLAYHAQNTPEARAKMLNIFFVECPERAKNFATALDELVVFQNGESKQWVEAATEQSRLATVLNATLVIVGALFSMGLGFVFSRSLSNTIRRVVNELSRGATEVNSASGRISEDSQSLSASSIEQAAALQETVSALEEVSSMVAKNADNALRSQDVSRGSNESAKRGQESVKQVIRSIEAIDESNQAIMQQIESSNHEIAGIVKVISEIGAKTKVIHDIVFQTKLLSFNASVEAARAGEHGKGFAVVAEEVGNLAQMSGNAAQEIGGMLDESMRKVEGIVENTRAQVERLVATGKERVSAGSETATRCGEVLNEIVAEAEQLNRLVTEIAAASQEQAQGVQEINRAMTQLDQATQKNTATAQSTAAAAVELSQEADTLRSVVQTLRGVVEGAEHSPMNTDAPPPSNVASLDSHRRAASPPQKRAVGA